MNIFDIDELRSLTVSLAGETVRVVRGLLDNSKTPVSNKEELESFDFSALPVVMVILADYLSSPEKSDETLTERANAYREALAFHKNAPNLFDRQIIVVDSWRQTVIKREEVRQDFGREILEFERKASAWTSQSEHAARLAGIRKNQKEKLDENGLLVNKEDYGLFLTVQTAHVITGANQVLLATKNVFSQKKLGAENILSWRSTKEEADVPVRSENTQASSKPSK